MVVPAPGTRLGSPPLGDLPVVQLDRAVRGLAADAVLVDNGHGARVAVEHLIGLGHARIGLVSDTPRISSSAERIAGYRRALRGAGLVGSTSWCRSAARRRRTAALAALDLLRRSPRPTAVFTANNFMTVGTLLAARELGLRIPEDVALVGFDDLDWTTLVDPPLTAISQPVADLGRAVGERLLARIAGDEGPPRRLRLPTELIVRGSCGARP